jgi:hypothetical protein
LNLRRRRGPASAVEAKSRATRRAAGWAAVEGLLSDFSDHTTGINVLHDGGFTRAYALLKTRLGLTDLGTV